LLTPFRSAEVPKRLHRPLNSGLVSMTEPWMALLPPKEAAPGSLDPSSRDVENDLTVVT
jgi:hypothetical protein